MVAVDEGNGNLVQSSSSAPSCTNGYWSTVTLGGNSSGSGSTLDDRLSPSARQVLGQTRNLAQGPINVLSVVFVVEVGGILVVEAALPALEQGAELIDAVNEDILLTEAESPGTINATMDVLQGLGRPITVASTPSGWVARAIMRFWMLK